MSTNVKKIDQMINKYQISKTLRMSLLPVNETYKNFQKKELLNKDIERKDNRTIVQGFIDAYHRSYIESALSKVSELNNLSSYADAYYEKDAKALKEREEALRKEIADYLKTYDADKYVNMYKKEMFSELLPNFLSDENDKKIVASFAQFTTYFTDFFQNRKNMYTAKKQSTSIAYRCINDNLPKHLDNITAFEKAKKTLSKETLDELCGNFKGICDTTINNIFTINHFTFLLAQSGIDNYNTLIGGYALERKKVKGINEYINLYNQTADKSNRIPLLKPLYKQILSDRESVSFTPFRDDNELLNAIDNFYTNSNEFEDFLSAVEELFENFGQYSLDGIYIQGDAPINSLSNDMFKSWSVIRELWNQEYDSNHNAKKITNYEDYEKKRTKEYKNAITLEHIQNLISKSDDSDIKNVSVANYYEKTAKQLISDISDIYSKYEDAKNILENKYNSETHSLKKDEAAIALIKNFLDAIKALEYFMKPLAVNDKSAALDELFYSKFTPLYDNLRRVDSLYDKVRNYVTQKPYSTEKIKLNFENSSFLSGWAQDYDTKGAILFRSNGLYYLGIVNEKFTEDEKKALLSGAENSEFEQIIYDFQKPDNKNTPRLFIRSKEKTFAPAVSKYNLPINDVIDIYDNKYFKTNYRKTDPDKYKESLIKMIDYFKLGFKKHESYNHYNFKWKDSDKYQDISEFYNDTSASCYELKYQKINNEVLMDYVSSGKIYLFQIYNKDFSPYSKGTPNMHTLYFKMLFDEQNLKDVVYKLNGEAEMFYRLASIKQDEMIIHKKSQPIANKNPHTGKKSSVFAYDLIKDKRYTEPRFLLHLSITGNFKATGKVDINNLTRELLKKCDDNYVIGIDRGERHLLYVTVINGKGEIVEQYSLNKIINEYNGEKHEIDYHQLLDKKEEDRKKARQNWTTIENIKELKEGYISQVVHKICTLVTKYDAIIVMENLNSGFKRSRTKIEKQVYQKFEKMLIDKLNYLVDKKLDPEEKGGLLNAYQLTNKFESFKKIGYQNGFIFYIPAWLTSKIDPVTGFVDLMKPKYKSVAESQDFIKRFESISYNETENYFEFHFNYDNFLRGDTDYKKDWTVCTNGSRIRTFRNSDKNSEWNNEEVNLTDSFKKLFDRYSIAYSSKNIKDDILKQDTKDFYQELLSLLSLTLQMRNSITNSEVDYLISPVKDKNGCFYDSRNFDDNSLLPANADANGAYNIARKGMWAIQQIKESDDVSKAKLSISNKEWLKFAQSGDIHE